MNTRNLLIASVIGAVVTTALANIPIVSLLNCVVCLPFWGGPLLATWYYKQQTGTMPMNHAIGVGTVTGVIAGVLGLILNLAIGPAASAAVANQLQQYMPAGSAPIDAATATPVAFLLIGVVFTILFGVIGGLIGGAIFKDKPTSTVPPTSPAM